MDTLRWTSRDLELLLDDGKRYEIQEYWIINWQARRLEVYQTSAKTLS